MDQTKTIEDGEKIRRRKWLMRPSTETYVTPTGMTKDEIWKKKVHVFIAQSTTPGAQDWILPLVRAGSSMLVGQHSIIGSCL